MSIQMVDLLGQYNRIKAEVDSAISEVIQQSAFINGPQVKEFEKKLTEYANSAYTISCGNGTDALQIALMALDIKDGDEIIVPAFTYIATVETAALLGAKIVLCDVDHNTCNMDPSKIEAAITSKTKAIVPVHLFGQCADMSAIEAIAKKHNLYTIEDNAQAIGADYLFSDGTKRKAGTISTIGTTSFFPSKNLGCYGDGGALFTQDAKLAEKIRMIANHGQKQKYYHDIVGINSRLDTMQAAILNVKIQHLDSYISKRQEAATFYDKALAGCSAIKIPTRSGFSTHVFHQYTIQVANGHRDDLKKYLESKSIPSMIYYPLPVHHQKAYQDSSASNLPISESLCKSVLSLPMHTELTQDQLSLVTETILNYFN